uniref:Eukaryotic translation initiation factor 2-alpha kinase 2 n=1 Tax=Monopterus albus TaxID=43700 RepID=A0A3Q3IQ97_MONAL
MSNASSFAKAMDNVTKLYEHAQKTRSELTFEDISSEDPSHNKTYTIRAGLNGKTCATGEGKTKKEAKQNAAEASFVVLRIFFFMMGGCLIAILFYYCVWIKNKVTVRAKESIRVESNAFSCSFTVGNKEYPAACGKTKKEAKEEAAKVVCQMLGVTPNNRKYRGPNFIGTVDHYCQKTVRTLNFIEEKRSGPSHNPQFFYKLVINNKEYPVAEGKSVKEAKQNAAELAWSALQEQSDWDSKVPQRSAVSVDTPPPSLSTPSSLESLEASSQSMQAGTSDSVIFTNSSSSSKDQVCYCAQNNVLSHTVLAFLARLKCFILPEYIFLNDCVNLNRFSSDFDTIQCLAKGGFGRVYKAREKLVDQYYAVKIVRCKEKALREVGALEKILHCNIVRYYNCWLEDSDYQWDNTTDSYSTSQSNSNSSQKYLYIKMELCDTRTLKDWINEKNMESPQESKRRAESVPIVQQIVSGVECIHSNNFIHRDLKTEKNEELKPHCCCVHVNNVLPSSSAISLSLKRFPLVRCLSKVHVWEILQMIKLMLCEKPEDRPEASALKAEMELWAQTQKMHQMHMTV